MRFSARTDSLIYELLALIYQGLEVKIILNFMHASLRSFVLLYTAAAKPHEWLTSTPQTCMHGSAHSWSDFHTA